MLEDMVEDGKMEWIEEAHADKDAPWDRTIEPLRGRCGTGDPSSFRRRVLAHAPGTGSPSASCTASSQTVPRFEDRPMATH